MTQPELIPGRTRGSAWLLVKVPSRLAVRVDNQHGAVDVRGVAACRISNRFGEVRVEDVAGAVEVANEHGPVNVVASGTSPTTVENSFGPVEVSLPAGAAVRLDAETRFGEIEVPEGWNVSTEVRGPDYASARGLVGQDGFPLTLRNRHGPIRILLASPGAGSGRGQK